MTDRQRALRDGSLIGFRVAATIAFAAAIGAWFVWLRPQGLGGPAAYVVVSGESMVPTLQPADLAIARREDRYEVGDVVVYRVPPGEPAEGSLVIHRITGGDATTFAMRGDSASAPDLWRPTTEDVVGRVTFVVPQAGRLLPLLRMPRHGSSPRGTRGNVAQERARQGASSVVGRQLGRQVSRRGRRSPAGSPGTR